MKRLYLSGIKSVFYFFVIAFVLSACKDEVKDTTSPAISITNLTENQKVRGNITIKFVVSDLHLDKVYFTIDNVSIKTITQPPYQADIDTRDFSDGNHTLKFLAADLNNNSSVAEVSVEFRNLMLTVETGNSIRTDQNSYVIIYDMEAQPIYHQLLGNNSTVSFPFPNGYDGWDFNATYLTVITGGNSQNLYSETIQRCNTAHWRIPDYIDYDAYLEENISFVNAPALDQLIVSNGSDYEILKNAISSTMTTIWEPDNIFAAVQSGGSAKYAWLPETPSGNISIDLNVVADMQKGTLNATIPVTGLFVFGNIDSPEGTRNYLQSYSHGNQYYYANIFDSYTISLQSVSNLKTLYQTYTGNLPVSLSEPTFDISITSAKNDTVKFETNGDFDYFASEWRYSESDPVTGYQWASFKTFGGPDDIALYFPLPEELGNVYPQFDFSKLQFLSLWAEDDDAINGYDHFASLYYSDKAMPGSVYTNAYSVK